MSKDENIMTECLKLAILGSGKAFPNPLVGCIIIKNNKIIGKGYHKKYGDNHAEVNAIADAKRKGHNLSGSTLFVNLEPCSHFGKTPPCTDLIIKEKIKNVVVGISDNNPLVNGIGIKTLRENGINVKTDILKSECFQINKLFFTNMKLKLPYITLKVAQSLDGNIALSDYTSKYITGNKSREFVLNLRQKYDAILVGHNTVLYDNPGLLCGNSKNNPARLILSSKPDKFPENYQIFNGKAETYFLTSEKNKKGYLSLMKETYKLNLKSVLVEGGSFIFSKFFEYDLWDDMYYFISGKILGNGIQAFNNFETKKLGKAKRLKIESVKKIENDLLIYFKNNKK